MDNDRVFIPGRILTVLIALFSCITTHIPLIKRKKRQNYLSW